VAQAEACGLEPEPSMNPILLKPNGQGASQVVVNGRLWRTLTAREYYEQADAMRAIVLDAYRDLASRFDVIVIEGAGSVSELNLRQYDLVNLQLVTRLGAQWVLVADIERGGVFGSVLGTVGLLTPDERDLFRGFLINKFRGDVSLFDDGVRILEERTASRCFGVFPHADGIHLDAEDSLAQPHPTRTAAPVGGRIAIVRLPHLSNSTDFRLLTWADWLSSPPDGDYDAVILPGTKNTIADLQWLRGSGLADWVLMQHQRGATIVGICGGFQMLGRSVRDPWGMETADGHVPGLSLVPADTELAAHKVTRAVTATTQGGVTFQAYEIHLGMTRIDASARRVPFARIEGESVDGIVHGRVVGTYLHGALEHPDVCGELFGIALPAASPKADDYVRLGEWFVRHARHLDHLGLDRRPGARVGATS
jgi:adenosylcobyric acid synthase